MKYMRNTVPVVWTGVPVTMTGIAGHDPGIIGHVRPESLVTLLRNTHGFATSKNLKLPACECL